MEIGYNWTSDATIQWSPVYTFENYYIQYNLSWTGAKVNGTSLNNNNFGFAIMDSGTTFADLNQVYLNALFNFLNNSCSTTNLVGICGLQFSESI